MIATRNQCRRHFENSIKFLTVKTLGQTSIDDETESKFFQDSVKFLIDFKNLSGRS